MLTAPDDRNHQRQAVGHFLISRYHGTVTVSCRWGHCHRRHLREAFVVPIATSSIASTSGKSPVKEKVNLTSPGPARSRRGPIPVKVNLTEVGFYACLCNFINRFQLSGNWHRSPEEGSKGPQGGHNVKAPIQVKEVSRTEVRVKW